jgi:F-type H+-transporting ATPase subunit b
MSASWVTFLFEAANFMLLAAVLGWLFFRPVRDALERRRSELESEQQAAVNVLADAERALQDAREQRSKLEDSLEGLRERVRREAETEAERLVEAARVRTQRERETLKGELVSQRRAQARSLTRDAAFAAREIVVRLLDEIEGPDLEDALLRTACRDLEKLRSSGSLAPVIIESNRPLDHASLACIAEAAGIDPADPVCRVDPDLVAGLRVLTARGLVDASGAGLALQAERVLVIQVDRENSNHG